MNQEAVLKNQLLTEMDNDKDHRLSMVFFDILLRGTINIRKESFICMMQ